MESEKFFSLAWYDWCLWMERIKKLQQDRLHDHEVIMDLGRRLLSQYWNWNRGNKGTAEPADFWKLSWDPEVTDTKADPDEEERIKRSIQRAELIAQKRFKRKGGG